MTTQQRFSEVLSAVVMKATHSAVAARKEIKGRAEHERRSLGQKVRWQIERILK